MRGGACGVGHAGWSMMGVPKVSDVARGEV